MSACHTGHGLGAEQLEREPRVAVVVRARERDDRDPGALGALTPRSPSSTENDSINGFASSSCDIRSTRGARLVGVVGVDLDVDEPPDAGTGDGEPERAERLLHRLALRVEDAFLGTDQHGRLHSTTFGSER